MTPTKFWINLNCIFVPKKDKHIARHPLFKRKQSSEESFDNFVKDLHLILLDCEYVQSEDVLVDAIIQGVYEEKVQERLLDRGEEVTLAKALQVGQQYELSRTQVRIVRDEDTSVTAVYYKQARPKPQLNPAPQLP